MTELTNRKLSDKDYKLLQDRIAQDILRVEREAAAHRAKNPPKKRPKKCGCTSTWVCLKHQGEGE
jgi:hypothetical protein